MRIAKRNMSAETKEKISKGMKNRIPWNKGLSHSSETKEKIRISHIGENPNLGVNFSEESKKRMSESKKGKPSNNKGKPAWNKGISPSSETKQKMKESRKKYLSNKN